MIDLAVDTTARTVTGFGRTIACAIGRAGACPASEKREGDGKTPLGSWPIRSALLRPGRVAPSKIALPWRWLRPDDGWSDEPADPAYNQPVRHPHAYSAERLWREDGIYDLILVLGFNDAPPIAGMGSAIFLHCWRDRGATEGCIAVAMPDLLWLAERIPISSRLQTIR